MRHYSLSYVRIFLTFHMLVTKWMYQIDRKVCFFMTKDVRLQNIYNPHSSAIFHFPPLIV